MARHTHLDSAQIHLSAWTRSKRFDFFKDFDPAFGDAFVALVGIIFVIGNVVVGGRSITIVIVVVTGKEHAGLAMRNDHVGLGGVVAGVNVLLDLTHCAFFFDVKLRIDFEN